MAANDYYNKPLPGHSGSSASSLYATNSRYEDLHTPSVSSYPTPPPYASQQHLTAHPEPPQRAVSPISPNPFETDFDDHVYPAHSHGSGGGGQGPSPGSSQYRLNDIPLQNRPLAGAAGAGKDFDPEDHVHDASQRPKRSARKHGVRFGELGMLGAGRKRIPWVVYIFTVAQIATFIGEIIRNATLTGSPIGIHPQFNPMIGPSTYVLINVGARFVPCMHNVEAIQGSSVRIDWPCPNTTTTDTLCTLSQLCGFGGVPEPLYHGDKNQSPEPNQWFRFILPIFLHAGLIHIGFNLLMQLTMGREMEMAIGSIRFFLVYVSSGIFGFVMGGNFAAVGISSTGASGSLFGIIALTLLDLLYSWKDRRSPVKDLMFILLDVVISFVLGLLPGLDNFSHIGGFLMGLALGICVLHSPNSLRRRIGEDPSYASIQGGGYAAAQADMSATTPFIKNPIGFFKGRKPLWWAWWLVRAGALVLVLIVFIFLLRNFYVYHKTCSWCKYLSCLPVNGWCDIGNLNLTETTDSKGNQARSLIRGIEMVAKLYD